MDTFSGEMSIVFQAAIQVAWNFFPAILAGIAYGVYDAIKEMNNWRI